jgi:CIC family chloride channel protein
MSRRHIEIAKAGPTVADVMMPEPHTNSADEPVADARAKLAKSSVKLLVVVDGERFTGTVGRDDLPPEDQDGTLATIARADGPRLAPDDSVEHAIDLIQQSGAERVPVVDDQGVLRGLVCLNRGADHFCA